jgi:hypothetical protein
LARHRFLSQGRWRLLRGGPRPGYRAGKSALNLRRIAALISRHREERPMSFIDEIRRDRAAWLERARAEPEDTLPGVSWLSMSVAEIESLEDVVSGRCPRDDRPVIAARSASLGSAGPSAHRLDGRGTPRLTGGRSGAVMGDSGPEPGRQGGAGRRA